MPRTPHTERHFTASDTVRDVVIAFQVSHQDDTGPPGWHEWAVAGDVALRVYDIREQEAQLVAVTPAVYHPLEVIDQGRQIHAHPDGTRHAHDTATDVHGIYVAELTLERPGPWGLEIVVRRANGAVEAARLSVNALPQPRSPMPGTPAPRSRNLVAGDVSDLRQIDSSEPSTSRRRQLNPSGHVPSHVDEQMPPPGVAAHIPPGQSCAVWHGAPKFAPPNASKLRASGFSS